MPSFFSRTRLIDRARLRELKAREHAWFDLQLLKALPEASRTRALALLDRSRSQLRQDVFALAMLDFKRDGFFVEFGATDGVELNNTWLMETDFGWTGILAEPARGWHSALKANRRAIIDTRCVWRESGTDIAFTEAPRGVNSGISTFIPASRKLRGQGYKVETVSLNDLLAQHGAPAHVDYMSVDTEGSELDILQALDFDRWSFGVLTVEHGHLPQRAAIHSLLTARGYRQVLGDLSDFDDWYVGPGI